MKELKVWRFLRKQEQPVKVRDVVAALGYTPSAVRHFMQRLVAKKAVVGTGYGNARVYVATDRMPEDLRGTSPGTLAVLQKHTLAKLGGTRFNRKRPVLEAKAGIELDRCWRSS